MNISEVLKFQYPDAKSDDYSLQDNSDGLGQFISKWNISLGPQPTLDELDFIEKSQEFIDYQKAKVKSEKIAQAKDVFKSKLLEALTGSMISDDIPGDPLIVRAKNTLVSDILTLKQVIAEP